MLITLLLWLYISVICLAVGDLVWKGFQQLASERQELPLPALAFLGWAGLTNFLGYTWLFLPAGIGLQLFVVLVVLGWYKYRRRYFQARLFQKRTLPSLFWLAFLSGAAVILTRTTHLPRLVDTGGYHAPIIRWISEYAVIPGLANVNYRFGFNNASFLSEAFFSLSFLKVQSFHVLNGWLMLILFGWSLYSILQTFRVSNWYIIGFGVLFLWHSHWRLSSPSPDHPAQLLVGFLFYFLIRQVEGIGGRAERILLVWLTLLAFTIKMSTLIALLVPVSLFILAIRQKDWKQAGCMILVGLLPLIWWLTSNVILTGYIIYPSDSALLDWFSFDWKVPAETIRQGLKNLSGGTKLSPVKGLLDFSWVLHWWTVQPIADKTVLLLLVSWPVLWLIQRKKISTFLTSYPGWPWLICLAYAGILFWFINAPEMRFGMGFIVAGLLLPYAPFVQKISVLVFLGLLIFHLALLYASFSRQATPLLIPNDYPKAQVNAYILDGHPLYYATDDPRITHGIKGYWGNCQDMTLPCCPYYNPNLVLRSSVLKDGFKIRTD
ncbi:MAG: hypothetical protein QM669_15380 [Siphonobacter sp.]